MSILIITGILCSLLYTPLSLYSQIDEPMLNITGVVLDMSNQPIKDVKIESENGRNEGYTLSDGTFSIDVSNNNTQLVFSAKGYRDLNVNVDGNRFIEARLVLDTHRQDQMISLGYFHLSKNAITGAVSTIGGHDLEKTPTPTLSYTFEGRLAGVITKEMNAELSKPGLRSYIRGTTSNVDLSTVYIVDGVLCIGESFEFIIPQEIESVTVLKDASTLALYGIQGASRVFVITTKRGQIGELKVNVSFNQSFQQMTRTPYIISSGEYAHLRNEAAKNDMVALPFSQTDIDKYMNGKDPEFFPNIDYYNLMMRPYAHMQRSSINISGGKGRVKTFSNISMMHQTLQFKTSDSSFRPNMRRYNSEPHNLWFTYRSNLDFRINDFMTGFIRLYGSVRREKTAGDSNANIYAALLNIPPTIYGPYVPLYSDPSLDNNIMGGQIIATDQEQSPAYGRLNRSGFTNGTLSNTVSQVGVCLELDHWLKGLRIDGLFAHQMNARGYLTTRSDYERGRRKNGSFETFGTSINTPLSYTKTSYVDYYLIGNTKINYNRVFRNHQLNTIGFLFIQNYIPESTSGLEYFDYNRISTGIMMSYGYKNKYFIKADIGYSGSEQFERNRRFSLTPAIAGGWVISNENFLLQPKWLSYLKIRTSYGIMGNDQLGGKRYLYADDIKRAGATYLTSIPARIMEYQRGNPYLTPQFVNEINVGIDIGLFNELSLTFDLFRDHTKSMLIGSGAGYGIPEYIGIPLEYAALKNIGELKNKGLDIDVHYEKQINKDLFFSLSGNMVFAKNKVLFYDEAPFSDDYAYQYRRTNFPVNQTFGYLVDYSNGNGYFNSEEELASLKYSFGTPRLGDLKYQDLSRDGVIDEKDMAPIGTSLPQMGYGISFEVKYKYFLLSCLFQGVSKLVHYYDLTEYRYDGIFLDLHTNAWTSERYTHSEKITFPSLSLTSSTNSQPNDFFISDGSYVRLKNVHLAISLPRKWIKTIAAEEMKITLTGHNLFTWDHMKSKNIDPEMRSIEQFQPYKTYDIGLNIGF